MLPHLLLNQVNLVDCLATMSSRSLKVEHKDACACSCLTLVFWYLNLHLYGQDLTCHKDMQRMTTLGNFFPFSSEHL